VLLGMRGRDRGLFRLTERSEGPLAGPSPRELGAQRDGVPDLAGERLHRGPDLGVLGAVEIRGLEVGEPLDEERVDDRGPDEGALGLDVVQWYAPHLSPTPGTACIQPARAVAASASRAPGRGTRDSDARKGRWAGTGVSLGGKSRAPTGPRRTRAAPPPWPHPGCGAPARRTGRSSSRSAPRCGAGRSPRCGAPRPLPRPPRHPHPARRHGGPPHMPLPWGGVRGGDLSLLSLLS